MKFSICQMTRKGGRKTNQDRVAFSYSSSALLMVLADGMGGHLKGEVAADIAVKTITEAFEREAHPTVPAPQNFLKIAIERADSEISRYAETQRLREIPGTTVVACIIQGNNAWWGHAGDSRLYLFRGGETLFRTRDHSVVWRLVESGQITEEEAESSPEKSIIYNCLGASGQMEVELSAGTNLLPGDTFLICSDGLWGALQSREMGLSLMDMNLDQALARLIETAETRNGLYSDNITAVAVVWKGNGIDTSAGTLEQPVTTLLGPDLE